MDATINEFGKEEAGPSAHKRAEAFPRDVAAGFTEVAHFLGKAFSLLMLSPAQPIQPLPYENWQQLGRLVQLLTELSRAGKRFPWLGRSESLGRIEGLPQRELQVELLFLARGSVGDTGKEVKPLAELSHCFGHCTPRDRLLARLEPIPDRVLSQASFCAMLRQDCWLCGGNFGEAALQRRGNAGMQLLAGAAQ